MIQLIANSDVRKYRQLGKQVNADSFTGRVREVQENQLSELLGLALTYDFFNFLETGWTTSNATFIRVSDYVMEATGVDLSGWDAYSLKINSDTFVIVESAVFDGSKTTITVEGYILPTTLTTIEFRTENDYIKLLNGTPYLYNNETIPYNGLRPFLSWHFLTGYTGDGDIKHSDVGSVTITGDLFQKTGFAEKKNAISGYLQNATREENRIINYLNTEDFEFWSDQTPQNIDRFDFVISD